MGGNMQARKLRPEELWRSRLNMAVAFEGDFDWEKEIEKSKADQDEPGTDSWGAFLDGETAPCASLVMSHYQVQFDGHTVGLGGVGGVASLPASRRGGAVRACMRAALEDLYAHGDVLSALYPFSTGYYRKFGYENSVESCLWAVPLQDLPQQDVGGRVRQVFPGEDVSPLLEVYDAFYKGCNLAPLGGGVFRKELEGKNLLAEKRYVFLWEDGAGRPGAFLIFGRDGAALNCRTDFGARNGFLFRDAQGFTAMLGFVRRAFLANYKEIRFALPGWTAASPLLPECAHLERQVFFNGMVRAVNIEKLLGLSACKGRGALTLEVSDPLLPANQGVFRLAFQEGQPNRVERVQAKPDASLGVGELTALLCGVRTAEELRWMPGVAVHDPAAPFGQAFYHKPCHLPELF